MTEPAADDSTPVTAIPRGAFVATGAALQVRAGDRALAQVARWVGGRFTGIWGEQAPDQVVWVDGAYPARVGDWIVKTPVGTLVLSPEAFHRFYRLVEHPSGS